MRVRSLGALLLTAGLAASLSGTPSARAVVTARRCRRRAVRLGTLAFGPGNVLFAADPQGAAIYAFDLGTAAGTPGAADVPDLDKKLAAVLGTDAAQVAITDLAVHPASRNVYLAAMRGTGADRGAGAGPPRRRRPSRRRRPQRPEVHLGGPAQRAGRQPAGAPRSADGVDHRHGLRQRPADRRRPVERGVLVEAARGEVSVLDHRSRHQRRDLPRQPRRRRDALAGLRVRALHDRRHEADRRRLPVHAARHLPDGQPDRRHAGQPRCAARPSPSSAAATGRST